MENYYEKKYEVRGHALIYHMPKELDHHVSQQLCKELDMLIEAFAITSLELDFEQTDFMDSSGIGVIIGRNKTMQFRGGKIMASNMCERVKNIFNSIGLQKIVEVKEG